MARTTINTQVIPDGTIVSADLSYPLTDFSSTGIDDNATSTAITIDASENTFFSSANTHANSVNVASFANTTTGEPVAIALGAVADNGGAGNEGGIYFDAGADGSAANNQLQFNADHQTSVTPDMVITGSGNVGIGTSSPSQEFHLRQTSGDCNLLIDSANGASQIFFGDDESVNIGAIRYDHASNYMRFSTNSAERMRIDSSGNVGIGTTSPDALLHLESSTNAQIRFSDADDPLNNFVGLLTGSDTLYIACDEDSASSNSRIGFRIDGTERMRIDTGGNVGIGTTSPDSILHLSGSSASKIIIEDSANPRGNYIGINSSDNLVIAADEDNLGSSSTIQFRVDATERMRIDSNGNVGIGTASPDANLEIREDNASGLGAVLSLTNSNTSGATGNSVAIGLSAYAHTTIDSASYRGAIIRGETTAAGNGHSILFETSDTSAVPAERVRIDHDGNVGIGTTSTTFRFNVSSASSTTTNLQSTSSTSNLRLTNSGGLATIGSTSNVLHFTTSTTERMRIDGSGHVLVGTTSTVTTGSEGIELRGDFGYLKTARNNTGSTGHWLLFNPNGNVGSVTTSGSATQYNTSSDQRLKENIVDAPAGNIDAIRVRSFDWKADGSHQTYGMVAQELVDVAPEAVTQGDTDDDMWAVDYSKLVPMMIKEIQDLKAEVAALRGV